MPSIKCDCGSRVPVTQLLSESGEPKPTTPLADVERSPLPAQESGLLPCPFCRSVNLMLPYMHEGREAHVKCNDCGACGPENILPYGTVRDKHFDKGCELWNTRASDAGKEAERSEEDAIIERDHLSDLIQHLDEAAGFDGEYKAVIGSHVVDEDFMCERITTVLKNASKEYVRGLEDVARLIANLKPTGENVYFGNCQTEAMRIIDALISQHSPQNQESVTGCDFCDHPSGYFPAYPEQGEWVHRGRDNDAQLCANPRIIHQR